MGGFDLRAWTLAHSGPVVQNQQTDLFVRPGETADNWTEALILQTFAKPSGNYPIEVFARGLSANVSKSCPEMMWKKIEQPPSGTGEATIMYEWEVKGCLSTRDQHEVGKILYGQFNIFRISYVAKTSALAPEKKEEWIRQLREAQITEDIGRFSN